MKKIGILLALICTIGFIAYYQYAYRCMTNNMPIEFDYNQLNWLIYLCLSIAFVNLGRNEDRVIKYFVYYAIAEFWGFLSLTYVTNFVFNPLVIMHKVLITLTLVLITSLIYFLKCKLYR